VKKLIIIGITLILLSCTGSPGARSNSSTSIHSSHIITLPEPGNLIILGVAGRQSTRERELNIAKEDAARKASMYHWVYGNLIERHYIGPGFFDYDMDSVNWLEYDEQLELYMDRLQFDPNKDLTRDHNGVTYIRFSYPANYPGNISYWIGKNQDGSPEWTTRPPDSINGFIAGVGRSGRQERFANTVRRSYEAAVISIVSKVSTSMETTDISLQSQAESQISRQSSAMLNNFLILEIWTDPETGAVWTLAIAQT